MKSVPRKDGSDGSSIQGVQGLDIGEAVLGVTPGSDISVAAPDGDVDRMSIEGGQGILESHTKFPDHLVRMGELLFTLVQGEVLITQAPTPVPDMPVSLGVPADSRLLAGSKYMLIERVCDYLPQGVGHGPVFKDALDVKVEIAH
jgi:hypothetical protein